MKKIFLIEIGTEELPSKQLYTLATYFYKKVIKKINILNIKYKKIKWFASSRRLAIKIYLIKKYHKLYNIISEIIKNLSKFKKMRWGNGKIKFIRPVKTIILLLNTKVIQGKILGTYSNRITKGHRFLGKKNISIPHAKYYPKILLKKGHVIADYINRKKIIIKQIKKIANKLHGNININNNYLNEINSLVEWPYSLYGSIKKKFLYLPKEIILHILQKHQKYIPIYDKNKKILPYFIFIININPKNPKKIITDHEKVLENKLIDANSFFQYDIKIPLEYNLKKLKKILFYKNLGSMYEKSKRLKILSKYIAYIIGADIKKSKRAGLLAKCDLLTNTVFEFPETKGIIGMYSALSNKEHKLIALAIKEQYYPKFSKDKLPTKLISCVISIADKIDSLTGIIGSNYKISGNKDKFYLRRISIAIIKIIIKYNLSINLKKLINKNIKLYKQKIINKNLTYKIIIFFYKRLPGLYKNTNISNIVIKSIKKKNKINLLKINKKIQEIKKFTKKYNILTLVNTYKRISKILKKFHYIDKYKIYKSFLKKREEINLNNKINILKEKIKIFLSKKQYYNILVELYTIIEPINIFFTKILIKNKNIKLKINRLTILYKILKIFKKITNFSYFEKFNFKN